MGDKKLRSFATKPEYPGSSVAGQLKGFEILSPNYLPRRLQLARVALYFRSCLQHVEDAPAPPRQPRGESQSDRVRLGVAPIYARSQSRRAACYTLHEAV